MKERITNTAKNVLRHHNINEDDFKIEFGYDCFDIILVDGVFKRELLSSTIKDLEEAFDNEVSLIRIVNGNLAISLEMEPLY